MNKNNDLPKGWQNNKVPKKWENADNKPPAFKNPENIPATDKSGEEITAEFQKPLAEVYAEHINKVSEEKAHSQENENRKKSGNKVLPDNKKAVLYYEETQALPNIPHNKTNAPHNTDNLKADNEHAPDSPASSNRPVQNAAPPNRPAQNAASPNIPVQNAASPSRPVQNTSPPNRPVQNAVQPNKPVQNTAPPSRPVHNNTAHSDKADLKRKTSKKVPDSEHTPDKNKKKTLIIISSAAGGLILISVLMVLTFRYHIWGNHDWIDASCNEPQICTVCGAVGKQALGHKWLDAGCETPRICEVCGETSGSPAGHKWKQASCDEARICSVCGTTDGVSLGHIWVNSDCTKPQKCSRCGEEKEKSGKHQWQEASCIKPKTCTVCGKVEGKAKGHDWEKADCQTPKTCKNCGKTEGKKADHDWKAATISSPKTCKICGKTEGSKLSYAFFGYGQVKTDADGLYLREGPSRNTKDLMLIPNGTMLTLYTCDTNGWYYVEFDGNSGYVASEYVTYSGENKPVLNEVSVLTPVWGYINSDGVDGLDYSTVVENGPAITVTRDIGRGTAVKSYYECFDGESYWYEVLDMNTNQYYGWVHGSVFDIQGIYDEENH